MIYHHFIPSNQTFELPDFTIHIDPAWNFIGKVSLEVNGLADAEQYYFCLTQDSTLGNAFIVHFEHFHEENDHFFEYPRLRMVNLGGVEFLNQTWAIPNFELFHLYGVKNLFTKLGIQPEPDWLVNRYVTVMGESKKNELILFYLEPGSHTHMPLVDLLPEGKSFHQWPDIEKRLMQKALNVFSIISEK